jgi:hypothetical protein
MTASLVCVGESRRRLCTQEEQLREEAAPGSAKRTASQVGKASFRAANARCEVASVVFWDSMVRTCMRHLPRLFPPFRRDRVGRQVAQKAHQRVHY